MRLHRLELTAFGPFAETTEVDFDALGADGLFLLHGQTGAGKTTILDAIAFALYGKVPGSRGETKRLHSDHASPQTPPRVVLEATLNGRRLRLERTPEFLRPKKVGTGETKVNAKAVLTWLDGPGQHLSRIEEIGDEIKRLLGMSADQFFQVVLLPQGDFDRFLSADNEEREKLLERLFDTERFGTAEHWLADQRRAGAAELVERRQGIDRIIGQIEAVARAETAAERPDPVEWAQGLLTETKDEVFLTDAEVALRKADSDRSAAALADARRIAELRRRRDAARVQQAEYEAGAVHRSALTEELDLARQAQPVQQALADARAAAAAVAAAELDVRTVARKLAGISGGAEAAADGSDLDAAVHRWSGEFGALGALAADAADMDRMAKELGEQRTARDDLRAAITRIQQDLAGIPAAAAELDDRLRAAVEAEATLPGLTVERDRAQQAATAAAELVNRRKAHARCVSDMDTARAAHADSRERVLDLREKRLAGMAAELAGELVTGQACAVCGSGEHPAPARPTTASVTKAEEDAAVAAEQAAATARERATERLADLDRAIDLLLAQSGDHDVEHLTRTAALAAARLGEARENADRHAALAGQLDQLRVTESERHGQLRDTESRAGAAAERIDAIERRLAELGTRIALAVGVDGTVNGRRRRLTRLTEAAVALREARVAASAAATAAHTATERLAALVRHAGFAGVEPATAALRSPDRLTEIETELTVADRARDHAARVLAEPDILALADTPPVDPADLETVAEQAAAAVADAVAAHADATRRAKELEDLGAQLWAALDRIAPMQRKQDELAALAEVVAGRGENSRRMSLRSYVLAARLEEVALAGSVRLSRMSGGRYEFVHSDAAGPRGRLGGLGLDIRDDYTGAVRPSKTLSGGEKFMAALALALGLADTVAAESGGLVLDTMFIDEGFGSLDSAALDRVMEVLDELRAGGRVVGVVSHVDEMRQRIPSRLHVVRGRTGSRLETTVSGPPIHAMAAPRQA